MPGDTPIDSDSTPTEGPDLHQRADDIRKAHETVGDSSHKSLDDNLFKFMQDTVKQHASPLGKKLFDQVAKSPGGKDKLLNAAKGAFGMQPQPGGGGGGSPGGPSKGKDDGLSKLIKMIIEMIKALLKLLGINLGGGGPSMGQGQSLGQGQGQGVNLGQFLSQGAGGPQVAQPPPPDVSLEEEVDSSAAEVEAESALDEVGLPEPEPEFGPDEPGNFDEWGDVEPGELIDEATTVAAEPSKEVGGADVTAAQPSKEVGGADAPGEDEDSAMKYR